MGVAYNITTSKAPNELDLGSPYRTVKPQQRIPEIPGAAAFAAFVCVTKIRGLTRSMILGLGEFLPWVLSYSVTNILKTGGVDRRGVLTRAVSFIRDGQ